MQELKPTPLTIPLSWIYGLGSALYHGAFDRGFRKTVDLGRPVLSVGNLVVGGTGKTPVVMALAHAIVAHELAPAILTRGYGGSRTGLLRDGRWDSGEPAGIEAGDEPLLLSRMLPGVTIGIGKDRAQMARRVLDRERVDVFLLDDGFQHRPLHRQANILLLDAARPFGNGHVLPAGPLREFPAAIKRATAILLTGSAGSIPASLKERLDELRFPIWTTHARIDRFETLFGREQLELKCSVIAVAGIANPERFYDSVKSHGLHLVSQHSFPDHHVYTKNEVRDLEQMALIQNASLVTTAKDAIRLIPLATADDWFVAGLRVDIDGGWGPFLERILPESFAQKKGAAP